MTDYPTIAELKSTIEWAIKQGKGNKLLNDRVYPYTWGYYLHVIEEQTGVVIVAQTNAQLFAALAGEPQPTGDDLPGYCIDWDIRSDTSGNYCTFRKKGSREREMMMGSVEFSTPEEGAQIWLEQIKDRVPKGLWNRLPDVSFKDSTFEEAPDHKIIPMPTIHPWFWIHGVDDAYPVPGDVVKITNWKNRANIYPHSVGVIEGAVGVARNRYQVTFNATTCWQEEGTDTPSISCSGGPGMYLDADRLKPTGETMQINTWYFPNNFWGAGLGQNKRRTVRVYEVTLN